ncbi:MAG: phospholipase D-like domain-containing protein, partial [Bacillota bacterium]|nr:phospholipase D-like domain-containing protein [Bacillota bacterium]
KVFSPMKPFLTTHQNNRDHRKILVIDGHTAFTGGVNLADEYINRRERFGHWKDTAIMVKGQATDSFTLMFLQMWNIDEKVKEKYARYLYTGGGHETGMHNGGYVLPYGDSPFDHEEVGEKVYFDILNRAKDYVHIMSPYLILDEETINVLTFAAQRGVDVKIILPHIPDKKYAYLLARTYYEELIREGVEIYEYTPGFIHAKVFTSDDEKAVVGTINLDFRSLYLHFECAAYIWKNPVVTDIEMDFQNTLAQSEKMTLKDCQQYNIIHKFAGRALRLVAPLM